MESYIKHLKKGGLIAYPTETLWGVGGDATLPESLEALRALKQRSEKQPVSVLVSGIDMAEDYVVLTPELRKLLNIFWPGAVTFVLPAKDKGFASSLGSTETLGLRHSPHPVAMELVSRLGHPLTTTSVNLSGRPPAIHFEDLNWLPDTVLRVENKGDAPHGQGSAVVSIHDKTYQILRPGNLEQELFARIAHSVGITPA